MVAQEVVHACLPVLHELHVVLLGKRGHKLVTFGPKACVRVGDGSLGATFRPISMVKKVAFWCLTPPVSSAAFYARWTWNPRQAARNRNSTFTAS